MAGREAQQAREARGARGRAWDWRVRRVADTGGAWWRVERVLVRQELQPARVMQFLAVLGWVLLRIGRSVFLCLFFGC